MKNISTLTGFIIISVSAVIMFAGAFTFQYLAMQELQNRSQTAIVSKTLATPKPVVATPQPKISADQVKSWETYTNNEYGFDMKIPYSWKGYRVLKDSWKGYISGEDGDEVAYSGPEVVITDPKITTKSEDNWRLGIPVMVFTPDLWKLLSEDKFFLGAAPIGPDEIGENAKYIFATPARYWGNFGDDELSWQEAQAAVSTFKAF
jgi:hypothetical protein